LEVRFSLYICQIYTKREHLRYNMKIQRTAILITISILLFSCNGIDKSSKSQTSHYNLLNSKVKTNIDNDLMRQPTDSILHDSLLFYTANGDTTGLWPVKNQPVPLNGAILPYNRVVAYYGNLYSKRMGALGEYPPKEMWERLNKEVKAWEVADPKTPVVPAVHYIAVVAQNDPMSDGKYRMRMPAHQIDSALNIAKMGDAIVFLDIQVGLSSVQEEVPLLEKYLSMPQVHLGIDPEFSMKDKSKPGTKIGTYDAEDINYCSEYLAGLVRKHNLSPKILVVHRFTKGMITNYQNIKLRPEVQIVINMDGFGPPAIKYSTQDRFIKTEPVQFTGFKLFYKNDPKLQPFHMLTPDELLQLKPRPVYIQYQ